MENNHAVQYDHFGPADVLKIVELPKPEPGAGEVRVKVKTAGINPGEAAIREGKMEKEFPSTFPSGQGTDFAGIVDAAGKEVSQFRVGDEVIGFTNNRNAQAEYVVVNAEQLIARPANVSWEVAGSLFVVGTTAYAAVKAVKLKAGETLVVTGAAGGVGAIAVQLAKKHGVTVVGLASEPHHEWLTAQGIIPVLYHGDTEKNIREVLDGKAPDALIDTSGKGYVAMAIYMGLSADRVNTIIDFEAAEKYKVKTDGTAAAGTAAVLHELALLVAAGEIEIPIAKTYPLNEVQQAYEQLAKHHTLGKIVLHVS